MAAILVFFFDLLSAHVGSHRDFTSQILKYLFFTYIHKRKNATVTYFLKFVSMFLKFICSLLMHSPLKLSYALLANYMPKCQMSSGPYGPIFKNISPSPPKYIK